MSNEKRDSDDSTQALPLSEDQRLWTKYDQVLEPIRVTLDQNIETETAIINGHDLRGELILSEGLGAFMVLSPGDLLIIL